MKKFIIAVFLFPALIVVVYARITNQTSSDADVWCVGPSGKEVCADTNGHFVPTTDNAQDLGSSSLEFRNLNIDGTATIDQLVIDDYLSGSLIVTSTLTVQGNAFSVGTSTLAVSNGRLGLGTAGPQYTLDVQGSARISNQLISQGSVTINTGADIAALQLGNTASQFRFYMDNTIGQGNLSLRDMADSDTVLMSISTNIAGLGGANIILFPQAGLGLGYSNFYSMPQPTPRLAINAGEIDIDAASSGPISSINTGGMTYRTITGEASIDRGWQWRSGGGYVFEKYDGTNNQWVLHIASNTNVFVGDPTGPGGDKSWFNPFNKLMVIGNASIGANYIHVGSQTAPSNGLIVEGSVGVGTTTVGTDKFVVASSTTKMIAVTSSGDLTALGAVRFSSRTLAQLLTTTPSVGDTYFCATCSPAKIVTGTGTSAGNFADAVGGSFK